MTSMVNQDIPVSLKCSGATVNGTIPAGISTYFLNATHILGGAWVKPTRLPDGATYRDFMIFRGDSGGLDFFQFLLMHDSNRPYFQGLGGGMIAQTDFQLPHNQWTHMIAEMRVTENKVRVWANGVLIFERAAAGISRNLATVTSVSSTIGDNGTPGFEGQTAQTFICNRDAAATQAEIDDIYCKGALPASIHAFQWPARVAVGTTLPCLNRSEESKFPQNQFDAVLSAATMYVKDTPMTGRIVDRDAGHCIFTSGLAGYYRHVSDRPYNELIGKRYVGASIWAQRRGPVVTGSGQYCFIMQTNVANAALLITANSSGTIEFGGRSDNADSYNNAVSGSFAARFMVNEWMKLDLIFDYQAKLIQGYVNGVLAAVNAATNWIRDTFQVTRGSNDVELGHSSLFWPGKLDDFMIFSLSGIPSAREMREWYLKNQLPSQISPACFIDCNDFGPDLIDKSGNNITFNPVSIAVPYGLNPKSYMDG